MQWLEADCKMPRKCAFVMAIFNSDAAQRIDMKLLSSLRQRSLLMILYVEWMVSKNTESLARTHKHTTLMKAITRFKTSPSTDLKSRGTILRGTDLLRTHAAAVLQHVAPLSLTEWAREVVRIAAWGQGRCGGERKGERS